MREFLVWVVIIIVVITGITISWNKTAYRDVDELKVEAPQFVSERGFTVTSYDGYTGGYTHGGAVWYQVRDTSGYLYTLAIRVWRGELHLYNIKCLNAVLNK